jgi:hypothetical protein
VLRNFAGSLPGKLKTRLATEVSNLGLRAINAVMAVFRDQLSDLRTEIRQIFLDRGAATEDTVDERADRFIFELVVLCGHAIVKRISFAIGSEELVETYKELLEHTDSTAMRLIECAIHLDHFRIISLPDMEELRELVQQNSFASNLLRQLIWDRLYLFEVDHKQRQWLCDRFGIRDSPQLLNKAVKNI